MQVITRIYPIQATDTFSDYHYVDGTTHKNTQTLIKALLNMGRYVSECMRVTQMVKFTEISTLTTFNSPLKENNSLQKLWFGENELGWDIGLFGK